MFMSRADMREAMRRAVVIVDTHEKTGRKQDGTMLDPICAAKYETRVQQIQAAGLQISRRKLDVGDYTIATTMGGALFSLETVVTVERKACVDELIGNMCSQDRGRFEDELSRAAAKGTKMILLIEDDLAKIWRGEYRSKAPENAVVGSLISYQARYGLSVLPVPADKAGAAIAKILRRELETFLTRNFVL